MYKNISVAFITTTLKSHSESIQHIHNELIRIFNTNDINDSIVAATFHSELHEMTSKTNKHHDLHDVYEHYRKINREWDMSVKSYARDLVERLETINRIIACYNNLQAKEKLVLNMLYIEHTYKEGMIVLDSEYEIQERTALRIRKKAIDNILRMYHSTFTNLELYKIDNNKNNKYR